MIKLATVVDGYAFCFPLSSDYFVYITWTNRIGKCESNGFENIQGGDIKKCPSSDSIITTEGM